jgi:hypothetical protein
MIQKDLEKDIEEKDVLPACSSRGVERFLSGMSSMVQVVGVIFGIVIFIWGVILTEQSRDALGVGLVILSIPVMLTSIAMGALMRVVSRISNSLHDINEKLSSGK